MAVFLINLKLKITSCIESNQVLASKHDFQDPLYFLVIEADILH